MISFNLICSSGHGFEGWFGSSTDYDDQEARGLITCPICGDTAVNKALMTPNLASKSNQNAGKKPLDGTESNRVVMASESNPPKPETLAKLTAEIRKVQSSIERQCDDVGDEFAEEARKIHYGETDPRGIYGRTSDDEAAELLDEGIAIAKMPWLPKEH